MDTNTGLFTPNQGDPAQGTGRAVTLEHAASVRPCEGNPHERERAARAGKEDVEIVVGPHGARIKFLKEIPDNGRI
jgi:hypothetical protein